MSGSQNIDISTLLQMLQQLQQQPQQLTQQTPTITLTTSLMEMVTTVMSGIRSRLPPSVTVTPTIRVEGDVVRVIVDVVIPRRVLADMIMQWGRGNIRHVEIDDNGAVKLYIALPPTWQPSTPGSQ